MNSLVAMETVLCSLRISKSDMAIREDREEAEEKKFIILTGPRDRRHSMPSLVT